jgi:hypothetical protein
VPHFGRPLYLYQIAFVTPNEIDMTFDDCLFVVCLFALWRASVANDFGPGGTPKIVARFGRRVAAQIL